MTADTPREKVLVFGGNGFIGSELVHQLLLKNEFDVSIVSRGNWYFDSEIRIKPFVQHFICDRENSDLEYCTQLTRHIEENHFKFVVDFSAYKPEVLEASVELLNNKTDLYVYVSSDSVYEVCEDRNNVNGGKSREIDAVRPETEDERDQLNDLDEYGNEKLMGEEFLVANREAGGCNFLIVRLPDVIGPRDTTERIWFYILWIQLFEFIKVPIYIPKHVQSFKSSYVYVKDVVRAILHLTNNGFKDDVFNVGFEETLTLHEFLMLLASEMGRSNVVKFDFTADDSYNVFPSVTRGPVDIMKLKSTGFQPTNIKEAIHETVEFYKDGFYTYESERDDIVHQITRYVIGRERKGEFLTLIDQMSSDPENEGLLNSKKRTEL